MSATSSHIRETSSLRPRVKGTKRLGHLPRTKLLSSLAKNHETTIAEAMKILLKQVHADTMVDTVKTNVKGKEKEEDKKKKTKKFSTGEEAVELFRKLVLKTTVEDPSETLQTTPMYLSRDDQFLSYMKATEKTAHWLVEVIFFDPIRPRHRPCLSKAGISILKRGWGTTTGAVGQYIPPPPRHLISPLRTGEDPKVIFHFMRHGQALHNLLYHTNKSLFSTVYDPALTPLGLLQCLNAALKFPYLHQIDHIFASPLRRTLQTALATFISILNPEKKIVAWTELREFGNGRPGHGDKLKNLKKLYDARTVDLRLVEEGWGYNSENEGVTCTCCRNNRPERVRPALEKLRQALLEGGEWNGLRYEKATRDVHVVFVSHAAFLGSLLGPSKMEFNNTDINSGYWEGDKWVSIGWYRRG